MPGAGFDVRQLENFKTKVEFPKSGKYARYEYWNKITNMTKYWPAWMPVLHVNYHDYSLNF